MMLEKLDIHIFKNNFYPYFKTITKLTQMNNRYKCKSLTVKLIEDSIVCSITIDKTVT